MSELNRKIFTNREGLWVERKPVVKDKKKDRSRGSNIDSNMANMICHNVLNNLKVIQKTQNVPVSSETVMSALSAALTQWAVDELAHEGDPVKLRNIQEELIRRVYSFDWGRYQKKDKKS